MGIGAGSAVLARGRSIENPCGIANCAHPLAVGQLGAGEIGEAARIAGHPPTLVYNLLALWRVYRAVPRSIRRSSIHGAVR